MDKIIHLVIDYYREPRLVEEQDKTKFYLQKYAYLNKKREDYYNDMQEEFAKMIKSINKYKGFYIGRYETGDNVSHYSTFKYPKIVRYNSNISYVTWYNAYIDLERLSGKTEKYVKTGIIYDSLREYTLKWLNETDTRSYHEISGDSGSWGNYQDNDKTVTSGGTTPARTGAIQTITYKAEIYNDSPTSSNNIFDIAGNVYEWTMAWDNDGVRRVSGGAFPGTGLYYPASSTFRYEPNTIQSQLGVRGELLIK